MEHLTALKVGSKVRYQDGYGRLKTGSVLRITPTGQIVIRFTFAGSLEPLDIRCDKNGRQIASGSAYRFGNIISENEYIRLVEIQKRKDQSLTLLNRLRNLTKHSVNEPELVTEMETLLSDIKLYQEDHNAIASGFK